MSLDGVGPDTFRLLLGSFPSGVTVLTTRHPDGTPLGMTASAFCSVSLDPPLVLVCVGLASGLVDALRARPHFAVNILADDQETLSEQFAGERTSRFTGVGLALADGDDLPLLSGTAGWLRCETTDVLPGGDHAIFLARVLDGATFPRAPLIHCRGAYGRLAPESTG